MTTPKPFSVIIADDQLMVAEGLSAVLEQHSDFKVIALVPNGEKLVHLLNESQPDLVLLDLNMPVMDGFAACEIIRKRYPKIIVVALTSYDDDKIRKRVMEAGATGMLLKYMTSAELTSSIRQIMKIGNGQIFFTSEWVEKPLTPQTDFGCDKFAAQYKLSEHERKVMVLVAEGLSSKEIGDKLNLSIYTVKTHRQNLYRKLKVNNAIELLEFVHKYFKTEDSGPVN